jgi:transmembrane sensor
MNGERIQYLLQQYAHNLATRQEVEELFEWLKTNEGDEALQQAILDARKSSETEPIRSQQDWDKLWQAVQSATINTPDKKVRKMRWMQIAASLLLLVLAGSAWFIFSKKKTEGLLIVVQDNNKKDIAPGGNRAVLTLADGNSIVLDEVQNGLLAVQGNTTILKQKTGELIYNTASTSEQKAGEVLYNRVTTPRGGQYHVVLPDGSKVWLNAGSSLYFPATFTGSKRIVQLTGEAFFEVATLRLRSGQKMPFSVILNKGAAVEVLGTQFNINAYEDEPGKKVTLVEGSVKVKSVILKPGQQVSISHTAQISQPVPVQTEQAVAWKNGFFRFKDTGIRELMRQVERWYDVDIAYKTDRSDQVYTGIVSRSQNISALLQTLELTGTVRFEIEEKGNGKRGKVIVY